MPRERTVVRSMSELPTLEAVVRDFWRPVATNDFASVKEVLAAADDRRDLTEPRA